MWKEVDAIDRYDKEGKTYSYRILFDRIHIDEVEPDEIHIDGVEVHRRDKDDGILWEYLEKVGVLITEDKIFRWHGQNKRAAQKTAYFALKTLENKGWVSGYQKL